VRGTLPIILETLALIALALPAGCKPSASRDASTEGPDKNHDAAREVLPPLPTPEPIRPAYGAGKWYPAGKDELASAVKGLLDGARTGPVEKRVVALVSPHAGYVYSGPIAAEAYAAVRGKSFDTVVLVGPSHGGPLDGISVTPKGSFATPLGAVPVDEALASALLDDETGRIRHQAEADAREHSLENQIPFLQVALAGRFRILPVLIRAKDPDDYVIFADALEWAVEGKDKKVLLVASTDLSHFPAHDDAKKVDPEIMEAAASLDAKRLLATDREIMRRGVPKLACTMCGLDAVISVILAARALGGTRARILDVRDAFDVTGENPQRVVGYGAMAVMAGESEGLSMDAKRLLVSLARAGAEAALAGEDPSLPDPDDLPAEVKAPRGAFVTLNNPEREHPLRGCIGSYNLEGSLPLYAIVARMASSATRDSRFTDDPVTLDEMKNEIRVEVSVLSPFRRTDDPEDITLGVHGVCLVWRGRRRSVYLPQVATETGWDRATFLSRLCLKGGLPPEAWKDEEHMRFDLFTAEVFRE